MMGRNFYISDLHFGHANILRYDNRPWFSASDMDKALVENWNSVVTDEDTVYILGDFHWGKPEDWIEVLEQLNGHKQLILGNHDLKSPPANLKKHFQDIKEYKEISDNDRKVVLCHYPIVCFKNHFYGWYHLYGHVHNSFEANMMEHCKRQMTDLYTKQCNMFNVGCMMPWMNYTPRTLDEIVDGWNQYNTK